MITFQELWNNKKFSAIYLLNVLNLIAVLILIISVIVYIVRTHKLVNVKEGMEGSSVVKEGMSPAQRMHLARAYSGIKSSIPNKEDIKLPDVSKFDTTLKNPSNSRRKIRPGANLYQNVEKAANPTNVARGGYPMNYELKQKLKKSGNMEVLDNVKMNGDKSQPTNPQDGRSDIVPYGNSSRMAGAKQDLSPFLGITSAGRK